METLTMKPRTVYTLGALTGLFIAGLVILTLLLFWVSPAWSAEEVVVEGYGPDREAAFDDAKRNAVATVLGEAIESQTLVENFALVSDRILSSSSGYVTKSTVLEIRPMGDEFMMRIRALVEDSAVNADVDAVRVLSARRGNPRFTVLPDPSMNEAVDPEIMNAAKRGITQHLSEHGFELVATPSFAGAGGTPGPEQLRDLSRAGAGVGAEYVVYFSARALDNPAGRVFKKATALVELTAVHTGSFRILAETEARGNGGDEHAELAIRDAAREAGLNAAREASASILTDWTRRGSTAGARVTLTVRGIDGDEISSFQQKLSAAGTVKQVELRSSDTRSATFQVTVDGGPSQLAAAFDKLSAELNGRYALTSADGSSLSYQRVLK